MNPSSPRVIPKAFSSATRAMSTPDAANESNPQPKAFPRILCVEDDYYLRRFLSHTLSAGGYTVEFAPDAQHAFDQLMAQPEAFDLLITEHRMPRVCGLTLLTLLRYTAFSGRVIVLSSHLSADDLAACRALSVDSILIEPIVSATLTQTIEAVCGDTRRNARAAYR
jgi:CheY-like chemotaxis protein